MIPASSGWSYPLARFSLYFLTPLSSFCIGCCPVLTFSSPLLKADSALLAFSMAKVFPWSFQ